MNGFNVSKRAPKALPGLSSQVFDSAAPVLAGLQGLPTAAFLVPAALEAIATSDYAFVTAVVHGEADSFCAQAVHECDGVILTNDSDLLVYDLGTHGKVAFFNQLEFRFVSTPVSCNVLQAAVCQPSEIARRLGVKDIRRLAFEINRDTHITLLEAISRTTRSAGGFSSEGSIEDDYDYGKFCQGYRLGRDSPDMLTQETVNPVNDLSSSQFLDPRISELVLSYTSSPLMYLPFLLDDPSRSSAWTVSTGLRLLAYSSLIPTGSPSLSGTILEYGRRGLKIEQSIINLLQYDELIHYATRVLKKLRKCMNIFAEYPHALRWRVFAVCEIFKWQIKTGKKPPSKDMMATAWGKVQDGRLSWNAVHFYAQIEGILYSLRMLKQILDHLATLPATLGSTKHSLQSSNGSLPYELSELWVFLSTLPPLSQLLPSRLEHAVQILPTINIDCLLDLITSSQQSSKIVAKTPAEHETPENADPQSAGFQVVTKKSKRKPEKAAKADGAQLRNTNRFGALISR